MDTSFLDNPELEIVEFTFDGISIEFFQGPEIRDIDEKEIYVADRIARSNGLRISDTGLTVQFAPSFFEGHDTFISVGFTIGRDCTVGARTSIGGYVQLGSDVNIGPGCTLGEHVTVGNGVKIGAENYFPDLTEIESGVEIPPSTFGPINHEMIKPAFPITQQIVDQVVRSQSSLISRFLSR